MEDIKKEVEMLELDGMAMVETLKQSCRIVPDGPGVYVVLGGYDEMPEFLEKGTGPEFYKKKDKNKQVKFHPVNYPVDELEGKWVEDTLIMYIGKSDDGLRKRISTCIRFGCGEDVAHRGGRAIWQLPDSDRLCIGWKKLDPAESAREKEKEWIKSFKDNHGQQLPYANWKE